MAFVLEQQGRSAEAIAAYRKSLALSPANRQVRERLEALEKANR